MMVNEALTLLPALGVGFVLGGIFYGGLWWTVNRALHFRNPALWFLGSLLLRTGVTMAGFYLVFDGRSEGVLVCLLGFIAARVAATRLSARAAANDPSPANDPSEGEEPIHAP